VKVKITSYHEQIPRSSGVLMNNEDPDELFPRLTIAFEYFLC